MTWNIALALVILILVAPASGWYIGGKALKHPDRFRLYLALVWVLAVAIGIPLAALSSGGW
jgi:hypothetical protein